MKKLLAALLLLSSSAFAADIPIQGTFGPNGNFPIVHDADVEGGYHTVADTTARDAIPAARLRVGMLVYVVSTDTVYKLTDTAPTWAEFSQGASSLAALYALGVNTASSTLVLDGTRGPLTLSLDSVGVSAAVGLELVNPTFDVSEYAPALKFTSGDGSYWSLQAKTPSGNRFDFSADGSSVLTLTTTPGHLLLGTLDLHFEGASSNQMIVWNGAQWLPGFIPESSVVSLTGDLASKLALAGGTMTGAITFSGTQLGTYSLGGVPTLGASLGIGATASYAFGDTTHLLTALATARLIGGSSNTSGHVVPNVADDTIALLAASQALTNKTISGSSNTLSNIGNSSLTNSSVTVGTSSPLGGGGSVALGASLSLTCSTCITGSPSATGDVLYSTSGGQAQTALADVAAGSYLRSGGVGAAPLWSTVTLPNAATTGDILYASGSNAIGRLADVATNQVLLSGGVGAAPAWGTVANAALANSSIVFANGTGISGGATVSLGGTYTPAVDQSFSPTWTGSHTFNTNSITLGAAVGITGTAGAGALALGSLTGATALPTGNLSYAGASGKTISFVTTAGAATITAGAASTWSTSSGALSIDSAAALNLGPTNATSVVLGRTGQTSKFNSELVGINITPTYGFHQRGGSARIQGLPAPAGLTPVVQGTPGTTRVDYYVYANDIFGNPGTPSAFVSVTTANAVLDSTNKISLSWSAVAGASTYTLVRRFGGGSPSTVGPLTGATAIAGTSFVDTGVTASGITVISDHTADTTIDGALMLGGITSAPIGTITVVNGGIQSRILAVPAAPTVTNNGTTGATTDTYAVAALDEYGNETTISTTTSTTTANATLTTAASNTITWVAITYASGYSIYRTAAGGTPSTTGKIATVYGAVTSFTDTGIAASGAQQTINQTGQIRTDGSVIATRFSGDATGATAIVISAGSYSFTNSGGASNLMVLNSTALTLSGGQPIGLAASAINGVHSNFLNLPQAVSVAGAPPVTLKATPGAHTSITVGTEYNAVYFDASGTQTWTTAADGTTASNRTVRISAPTLAGSAAGHTQTFTKAATVAINAAPTAGSNVVITNAYSFWVEAGRTQLDGPLAHGGTTLGFYGSTVTTQQTVSALTNNVTSGGSANTIADFTNLTTYATDAATIRNDIYRLAEKISQLEVALNTLGLTKH